MDADLQAGELRNPAGHIDAEHWLEVYADLLQFAQAALASGSVAKQAALARRVLILRQGIQYWLAVRVEQVELARATIERVQRLLAYPEVPLPPVEAVREVLEPLIGDDRQTS